MPTRRTQSPVVWLTLRAYSAEFDQAVRRNGGFDDPIHLTMPRDDYEAAALSMLMTELSKSIPSHTVVRIAPDNDNQLR